MKARGRTIISLPHIAVPPTPCYEEEVVERETDKTHQNNCASQDAQSGCNDANLYTL